MNTFGTLFRLTTFGESHGPAVGGVIDGMPSGIPVDLPMLQQEMARRRPGQSALTTARAEADQVELLSGIFEGVTTGCPIGFIVHNSDQHSSDYESLRHLYRPSHADFTYQQKYGLRDHRGGGRSSARETLSRCVGGAFAKMALSRRGIAIHAYTSQVGSIALEPYRGQYNLNLTETNPVRCPDPDIALQMEELIRRVKAEGDTIGGTITGVITGLPVGLGEPVFGRLGASLAAAMMSINAAKGFDYGQGFLGSTQRGSKQNDAFGLDEAGNVTTLSNNSGGIQGGISNGQEIYFRVAFKPVATLLRPQPTVTTDGSETTFSAHGRHDPCVLPRAVPIVEAMAAMVILDHYLINRASTDF